MVVTAQAESQQRDPGRPRRRLAASSRMGLSEASVLLRKIQSFSDPRLYALSIVAEQLAHSSQPLVPERVFIAGTNGTSADGHGDAASSGLLGLLINLLVAEKSGFQVSDTGATSALQEFADRMARQAMESMQQAVESNLVPSNGSHLPDTPGPAGPPLVTVTPG